MSAGAKPAERYLWARRSDRSRERMQGGARCRRRVARVRQEGAESESATATPRSDDRFHASAVAEERWRRSTLSVRMPTRLAMSWGSTCV